MSTRLACAALAAAVLAVTTSCQSSDRPTPVATTPGSPPSAAALPPEPTPTAAPCDLLASLRPQGPLPEPGRMPAESTMAGIAQRGYLIAGVNRDYYPFAVRDRDLNWEGFEVDIVRDIAQAILGDPEKVQFRPLNVPDRLPAVQSGDVDVVVATITITCKRRADAEFSAVYFEAAQKVLVNRGSGITSLADLGGKRVCAGRSSTSLDNIKRAPSRPIPVEVSVTTNCLALLQLGQVDAVSTDDALLAGMAAQDPQTEIVGPGFSEEPYGIAIKRDAPDLVRFVNAVLERRTRAGRWQASYQRWLVAVLGPAPPPPAPQYRTDS
ncbi:MAG: glutamate ABC transporter substrate-binding protein [Pseudonocardiaceae bacterium]